jgi:hypothetical protein
MADATFDGTNKIIKLANTGTITVKTEIYSAWKEWVRLSDNAKFQPAFDTTGGDDIGGGQVTAPYFFVRNDLGWRVEAPDADGEVTLEGNLYPRDAATTLFTAATGYDAFLRLETSSKATVLCDANSELAASIADAVWDEDITTHTTTDSTGAELTKARTNAEDAFIASL